MRRIRPGGRRRRPHERSGISSTDSLCRSQKSFSFLRQASHQKRLTKNISEARRTALVINRRPMRFLSGARHIALRRNRRSFHFFPEARRTALLRNRRPMRFLPGARHIALRRNRQSFHFLPEARRTALLRNRRCDMRLLLCAPRRADAPNDSFPESFSDILRRASLCDDAQLLARPAASINSID